MVQLWRALWAGLWAWLRVCGRGCGGLGLGCGRGFVFVGGAAVDWGWVVGGFVGVASYLWAGLRVGWELGCGRGCWWTGCGRGFVFVGGAADGLGAGCGLVCGRGFVSVGRANGLHQPLWAWPGHGCQVGWERGCGRGYMYGAGPTPGLVFVGVVVGGASW